MDSLNIKNISKVYNYKIVLNNVSFEIKKGEIIGLIGHNGAGKTTLLKIISGLVKQDKGMIEYPDESIQIGFMPDSSTFVELGNFQAYRFLSYISKIINPKKKINEDIRYYMEKFNLWEYRKQKIKNFSAGMRKKLNLIQLLLAKPVFWLIDEPFSSLDVESKEELRVLLSEFFSENKYGALIASHALIDLAHIVNKFIFFEDGKITKIIETKDIYEIYRFKKLLQLSTTESSFDLVMYYKNLENNSQIQIIQLSQFRYILLTKEPLIIEEFISQLLKEKKINIILLEEMKISN